MNLLSAEEWEVLWLSVRVALLSAAVLLPLGIALAWLLARRDFPGKTLVDACINLPLVLPPVVTGYLLLMLVGHRGMLGSCLEAIGLPIAFTWKAAVVAAVVMALPLMVRPIRASLSQIDHALEDAGRACGASRWRVAWRIVLPLAAPGIIAGVVLSFARSLGEFGATITLAGSIPGMTRTLPSAVFGLLQEPDGENGALRLSVAAIVVSLGAVFAVESLGKRLARMGT